MDEKFSAATSDGNIGGSNAAPSDLTSQLELQDLQTSGGKYVEFILPLSLTLLCLLSLQIFIWS